jgi:hypothetical protein
MSPLEVKNFGEEDEGAKGYGIESNRIHMGGNHYSTVIKMEGNLQAVLRASFPPPHLQTPANSPLSYTFRGEKWIFLNLKFI